MITFIKKKEKDIATIILALAFFGFMYIPFKFPSYFSNLNISSLELEKTIAGWAVFSSALAMCILMQFYYYRYERNELTKLLKYKELIKDSFISFTPAWLIVTIGLNTPKPFALVLTLLEANLIILFYLLYFKLEKKLK